MSSTDKDPFLQSDGIDASEQSEKNFPRGLDVTYSSYKDVQSTWVCLKIGYIPNEIAI